MSTTPTLLTLAPLATGGVVFAYYHFEHLPRSVKLALNITGWVSASMTILGAILWLPDIILAILSRKEKYQSAWQALRALPGEAQFVMLTLVVGALIALLGYVYRFKKARVRHAQGSQFEEYLPNPTYARETWFERIKQYLDAFWESLVAWTKKTSWLWVLCVAFVVLEAVRVQMGGVLVVGSVEEVLASQVKTRAIPLFLLNFVILFFWLPALLLSFVFPVITVIKWVAWYNDRHIDKKYLEATETAETVVLAQILQVLIRIAYILIPIWVVVVIVTANIPDVKPATIIRP